MTFLLSTFYDVLKRNEDEVDDVDEEGGIITYFNIVLHGRCTTQK